MVWLADGKKMKIQLLVMTEFTNVAYRQTDGRTLHDSIGLACIASRDKIMRIHLQLSCVILFTDIKLRRIHNLLGGGDS